MFKIKVERSNQSVFGPETRFLKRDGIVAEFETRDDAWKEVDRIAAGRSPHSRGNLSYTVMKST